MRTLKELRMRDYRTIEDVFGNREHFKIIEIDAMGAIHDLRMYDDTFFVVVNIRANTYEVHNVENLGNTYCFSVPALDGRMVLEARRSDIKNRNIKDIMREIDDSNAKLEYNQKNDFLNECTGRAEEVFPVFKKAFSDVIVQN